MVRLPSVLLLDWMGIAGFGYSVLNVCRGHNLATGDQCSVVTRKSFFTVLLE